MLSKNTMDARFFNCASHSARRASSKESRMSRIAGGGGQTPRCKSPASLRQSLAQRAMQRLRCARRGRWKACGVPGGVSRASLIEPYARRAREQGVQAGTERFFKAVVARRAAPQRADDGDTEGLAVQRLELRVQRFAHFPDGAARMPRSSLLSRLWCKNARYCTSWRFNRV